MLIKLNCMQRIAHRAATAHEVGAGDGIASPGYEGSDPKDKLKDIQRNLSAHRGP